MSEISGVLKVKGETKEFGSNGFQKREVVITTNDSEYPQHLLIEFVQDKCSVLDSYKVGENVVIGINLRGREWTNPQGEVKYFNSINGWNIKRSGDAVQQAAQTIDNSFEPATADDKDDLPF